MTDTVPEFRAIFRDAPTALAVCTRGEVILEANSAFAQLLGRTVDDLADTALLPCVHPGDRHILHTVCATTATATAVARRVRILRPDGGERAITVTASTTAGHGAAALLILHLDHARSTDIAHAAATPTLSRHHPATGLPDHDTFLDRCRHATIAGHRAGTPTTVTVVAVTTTCYGRLVAEAVAIETARRVTACLPGAVIGATGTVACVATGTFAVVSQNTTPAQATRIADRLRRETARPIHLAARPLQCATSVTVSKITDHDDPATLLAAMIRDTQDHLATSSR
ncbi:PAS domain-containing protein [Antrihabitans cavernicola]|uniref:PAS domain S-box protein n=1 Tax=Antrihabitans cavernicola TaxID=2495913 RepID=A0A5A7S6Y8_9NOCA|nr:PAS domain-containing protein [Spelaeibacter cavernicola]KAA0017012.1 PAS domain S-box protein [Spelaeibacter cavernicola]